jgi:hypothetical protein
MTRKTDIIPVVECCSVKELYNHTVESIASIKALRNPHWVMWEHFTYYRQELIDLLDKELTGQKQLLLEIMKLAETLSDGITKEQQEQINQLRELVMVNREKLGDIALYCPGKNGMPTLPVNKYNISHVNCMK